LIWLLCGLAGGLLVALWTLGMRRLDPRRPASAVIGATVWGLAEVLLARGPLFWIGLGSSSLPGDPSLAQLARLTGAGGIAALQLAIGWCLWRLVVARSRGPVAVVGLALLLAGHAPALAAAITEPPREAGPTERVLLVQPSIPTRRKFEAPEQRRWLLQLEEAQRRHRAPEVDALVRRCWPVDSAGRGRSCAAACCASSRVSGIRTGPSTNTGWCPWGSGCR
jgi:apolipoprotein N-acyltransferase